MGSRDRLCIHEHVIRKTNVNQECNNRVRATEKARKRMLKNSKQRYNDERPPRMESDGLPAVKEMQGENGHVRKLEPTCPHLRQLSSNQTAQKVVDRFRASLTKPPDIEDLVAFGQNPDSRIFRLRKANNQEWGMKLKDGTNYPYPQIESIDPNGMAAGLVQKDEYIFDINGTSTGTMSLPQVEDLLPSCNELLLRVGSSIQETGSNNSLCPYFTARALEKSADIVFCPYNYVLDASIRDALSLNIQNAVVVLDEAHNVEDCCRSSGSGQWSEFELSEMVVALEYISGTAPISEPNVDAPAPKSYMAHELLLFLEKILLFLTDQKEGFQQNGRAEKAIAEWKRFRTTNDTSFELSYDGPTGHGQGNKAVGCKPFFDRVFGNPNPSLVEYAKAMLETVRGDEVDYREKIFESMLDLVSKLMLATREPE